MKVEVGRKYKNKHTGEEYTVKDKLLFNTCFVLELEGEKFYCRYKVFVANFEEVS